MIGEHVAALIPNRATLQLGIGAIPDGVLASLTDREDLGVHTEMFSDGLVDLAERGVITNRYKNTWNGRVVTSFAIGTQKLYDFIDGNPFVEFHPSDIVNDTREIRKIDGMISVNSALEIDLTGQVVADSIGELIYSGIGGQMDFVRGAQLATRWQGHPRTAVDCQERHYLAHRPHAETWRWCGHHAWTRAIRRHRVWHRQSQRSTTATSRGNAGIDCPSRFPARTARRAQSNAFISCRRADRKLTGSRRFLTE